MSDTLHWLRQNWRTTLLLLFPVCVAYGALLALEGVAISWIDRWLPVSSFEEATRAAVFVTGAANWLRLCLIGLAVFLLLRRLPLPTLQTRSFGIIWIVGSAAVALAILVVDFVQHHLQYGGNDYAGNTVRFILLALMYAKIVTVYPGVRLLIGAASTAHDQGRQGLATAWNATSFLSSVGLLLLLIALKMTIETVLVSVISYLPFVAPFWFVPDELSRVRYFVGQGTRIVAESLGVMLYAAFFVMLVRSK